MMIRIWKASNSNVKSCKNANLIERNVFGPVWMVNIDSLKDLEELNKECGVPLIVNFTGEECEREIIVYDDYIE